MHKRLFLLLCLTIGSCPPTEPDAQIGSSITYCSGGQMWLPGHSAPSGPCPDPAVVTVPLGDLA